MTERTDPDRAPQLNSAEVQRVAMMLIEAVGCTQAVEKARRQERETVFADGAAQAVREAVEQLCAPDTEM